MHAHWHKNHSHTTNYKLMIKSKTVYAGYSSCILLVSIYALFFGKKTTLTHAYCSNSFVLPLAFSNLKSQPFSLNLEVLITFNPSTKCLSCLLVLSANWSSKCLIDWCTWSWNLCGSVDLGWYSTWSSSWQIGGLLNRCRKRNIN